MENDVTYATVNFSIDGEVGEGFWRVITRAGRHVTYWKSSMCNCSIRWQVGPRPPAGAATPGCRDQPIRGRKCAEITDSVTSASIFIIFKVDAPRSNYFMEYALRFPGFL